ncbi:MAG: ArsB/NhaD family transporter [Candidatus Omnitrophica bacterium]|nr:ArsB/NhaD family transporter [Candidatus Omnitrophota bacterium]MBU4148797.1 ArsB/NhaD family transporter [Candidatus Omnitrophota bacterium]
MLMGIIALAIVLAALYCIVTEKIDKVIALGCGALLMIIVGHIMGFYTQKEALLAIDFNTLGLLLGMMIIAAIIKRTGFFTYIAISLAKLSKGRPWVLMALLGVSTAFLSMLVDNVTTIVIIVPISILVCDILGIKPLPILMAEMLLATIGGVGTLVGDPPNIFIGSAAGLSFNDFLKNLFPVTLVVVFFSLFILRFIHRKDLSDKPKNFQAIADIDAKKAIKDPKGMIKSLVALSVTFILFFLHEPLHLYPSFIALLGAGLAFLLLRPNPEEIFHDVEWPVLAFFACFFVIVGGLHETGLLSLLAKKTAVLAYANLKLYKISLLWITAIFSSMVGAVPFTMIMLPIVKTLSALGINGASLWWILALGVGFGANGLPVGHAASILGISISEKSRSPVDIKTWLSSSIPVTIASLLLVTILIILGIF